MNRLILAAPVLAALGLSACAGLGALAGPGDPAELLKEVNQHIEQCERHYTGGTGVGAALTFRIDCPARPALVDGAITRP